MMSPDGWKPSHALTDEQRAERGRLAVSLKDSPQWTHLLHPMLHEMVYQALVGQQHAEEPREFYRKQGFIEAITSVLINVDTEQDVGRRAADRIMSGRA